jgi:O-antigen/teichoic acid export membrane protein
VATFLFNRPELSRLIPLAAFILVLQNLSVPGFAWLRAESRALFFSLLSITNLIVTLTANIVLVKFLHLGITGALMATGCGYGCVVLLTVPQLLVRSGLRVRRDIAWSLLTFGTPQVLSFVSVWILQLSDRYLLGRLGTLPEVASYSVAYSLGSVLATLIIGPFGLAWPTTMYTVAKRSDAPQVFRLIFRWLGMVLLFGAFGLAVASTPVLNRLFPASYRNAGPITPLVAAAIVFYGVYIMMMTGASIRRVVWMPAAFTVSAALSNVGLNLVLIPLYGSMGAAASTLIAYFLLAAIAYVANQRIYPVPYEVGRFMGAALVGAVLYAGTAAWVQIWGGHLVWVAGALGVVTYGLWLVFIAGGTDVLRSQAVQRGWAARNGVRPRPGGARSGGASPLP